MTSFIIECNARIKWVNSLHIYHKHNSSYFNLFLANAPISYPLKTKENLWFYGVFRGFKEGALVRKGLSSLQEKILQLI